MMGLLIRNIYIASFLTFNKYTTLTNFALRLNFEKLKVSAK
jgi:hypothetical protein